MPVLVTMDWAGVTEEQYDAARNLINLNLGVTPPKEVCFTSRRLLTREFVWLIFGNLLRSSRLSLMTR
jgi:hypothetical protein